MTDFVGSSQDSNRIRQLTAKREEERKEFEKRKQKIQKELEAGVVNISEKFAKQEEGIEEQLKKSTVGLQTFDDFKRKRETLEKIEEERQAAIKAEEEQKRKKRKIEKPTGKLSFSLDDEEEVIVPSPVSSKTCTPSPMVDVTTTTTTSTNPNLNVTNGDTQKVEKNEEKKDNEESDLKSLANSDKSPPIELIEPESLATDSFKNKKFGKNPFVNTEFLPDREREEKEKQEKLRLVEQYLIEQEHAKNEMIEVTYSYWDGSGHRRTAKVKKGTTIEKFLELVRQEFKELRGVNVENMMFVKEDLIIPHEYSFHDLIVEKARGKSGPLFHFDVHDDIRVINDATKEKDESHAAKVVERRWYERNKHIFPASRREVYDPSIKREKYTIKGNH